jgi:hypothetical protein
MLACYLTVLDPVSRTLTCSPAESTISYEFHTFHTYGTETVVRQLVS